MKQQTLDPICEVLLIDLEHTSQCYNGRALGNHKCIGKTTIDVFFQDGEAHGLFLSQYALL